MSELRDTPDRYGIYPSLAHSVLAALEDVMGGGDGWGCESQIGAINDLREHLGMPEWCARCRTEGHTTYSHFRGDHAARTVD